MTSTAAIGIAAIAKIITGYTVVPICHQLGYLFQHKRNVGNLTTTIQDLNLVEKRIQELVACATRNGDEIHEDTKEWLKKVDEITKQAETFLEDEIHAKIGCCSVRGLLFLNLVPRYRLSKKANKMSISAVTIKEEAKSDNISYRPHLRSDFTNRSYIEFESRKEIVTEIMAALEDGNVRMIGVHGLPGIGKTTLVKEISARTLDKKLFSDSVLVTVSNIPDVEQIQKAIAERLDLKLDKETIPERALLLQNRLKLEKKFLVILDDVWNELKLEDVGIVFRGDEKGCKILLTSRFERVLSTKMGADKIFQVGLLEEAEALNWFNHLVAKSVEKESEFLHLGTKIVNECACLPIAIETIAGTLKDRELPFWRTAWRQLQRSNLAAIDDDMDKKVHYPIELCYNYLGDEERLLLLLCGLHEEDESISIENLMRYGVGKGMFKDVDTLQSARDTVESLVFKIKDRSLLLDGNYHRTVKLHDVIRDVVISIARKSCMHSFTNAAEVNRLERKALEDSKAISLPNGYVPQLLHGGLEYKQLELIWMWRNKPSQVPDNFFEKTKKLRVLHLSYYLHLEKLPLSLSSLGDLRTLRLHGHHLEDIALIGELKNLEILDLSSSDIKELPAGIRQLTRLRMMDLHDCTQLEFIQPNVLSNLTSLEELYVERSFKKWDELQGVNGDKRNVSLNELKHLDKLTTLHLEIVDVKVLPKDLFSGKTLEQYKIAIGCELTSQLIENSSRCLELSLYENRPFQEHGLEMLLESTQILALNGIGFIGVDNIVYELDKAGFPELKLFQLKNNRMVHCLINSMEQNHPCSVFGSLEILHLSNLKNLEKICDGELTKESFKRLRIIEVQNCDRLQNLLPFSISKLEEIEIRNCNMMEEIIVSHEEGDNSKEVIGNFPKLCFLRLIKVPRLKSFCSKLNTANTSEKGKQPVDVDPVMTLFSGKLVFVPILKELELSNCNDLTRIWDHQILPSCSSSFLNLRKLLVKDCGSLEYLFSSAMATSFVQLRFLEISGCGAMKEILRNSEKMDKMSFPKLDFLQIYGLRHLEAFSSEIYIDFPVLTTLSIRYCPEFTTFVSKSEVEKLPCLFNEQVAFPSLQSVTIRGMNKSKIIANNADVFGNLEEVEVRNCNNLMKIFTSSMQRSLRSLRRLDISSCEMVEEVFEIQTSSVEEITQDTVPSQLISLSLSRLRKLEYVWGKDPRGTLTFTHLEDVAVFDCPSLKSIFPLSIAKGLLKLRNLHLSHCGIQQIVEAVGTNAPVPPEFVFPQLQEMNLTHLENLVCFYPGLHTSSWPSLTSLIVEKCDKVKVLASELSSFQENHVLHYHDSSPIQQPLIFTKFDPFPNLEKLELSKCNLEKIWDGELQPNSRSFRKLTSLHVECCGFLKYLFSSAEAANFEQLCALEIKDCMMMEEIMSKNEKVDEVQFNKLSRLNLKNLPNLISFSSEVFVEFPLLTEISINNEDCPKFKTFVSKLEGKD